VATDSAGDLFVADTGNGVIRQVSSSGVISTVAGDGTPGFSGDGGLATAAQLHCSGVAVDSHESIYVADFADNRVRQVGGSSM
jgi:hypothetical protein